MLKDGEDDAFLERVALIEQLLGTSDALYTTFLRDRLAPAPGKRRGSPPSYPWAEGEAVPASALKALAASNKSSKSSRAKRSA